MDDKKLRHEVILRKIVEAGIERRISWPPDHLTAQRKQVTNKAFFLFYWFSASVTTATIKYWGAIFRNDSHALSLIIFKSAALCGKDNLGLTPTQWFIWSTAAHFERFMPLVFLQLLLKRTLKQNLAGDWQDIITMAHRKIKRIIMFIWSWAVVALDRWFVWLP